MRSLFIIALLAVACSVVVQAEYCGFVERQFITDFYNAVNNCTEDPAQMMKLRALVADDLVWNSADNVTFIGGDIFVIYTCFPHVGITLINRIPVRDSCEYRFTTTYSVDKYVDSKNFLIYNITKDPLNPTRTLNATAFFKEDDDFVVTRNPKWMSDFTQPPLVAKVISSYASPREWYLVEGYLPPGFVLTKRTISSGPFYWTYPLPGSVIQNTTITLGDMLTQY